MIKWSPTAEDLADITPSTIQIPERFHAYFDDFVIDNNAVVFDSSTVEGWVVLLATLLTFADRLSSNKLTTPDITELANVLEILDFLLGVKEVESLFLNTSLSQHFSPVYHHSACLSLLFYRS